MLSTHGLLTLIWKVKKDVYMFSIDTRKRKIMMTIQILLVILLQAGIGGINNQAQMLASFPVMRNPEKVTRKWRFI